MLNNFMSGPGEGKIKIGKADVYIHLKGKSGASVTHLDIELDELNEIIKPKENSYVGGKKGGIFIGLKKEMIERAENFVLNESSDERSNNKP
jgi:hypothetical protein